MSSIRLEFSFRGFKVLLETIWLHLNIDVYIYFTHPIIIDIISLEDLNIVYRFISQNDLWKTTNFMTLLLKFLSESKFDHLQIAFVSSLFLVGFIFALFFAQITAKDT